jgi:hypothetical protein
VRASAAYSVPVEKLLEREHELAAVDELVECGGVVVVEGRAGIGKTALLEVACHRSEVLGREVLRARSHLEVSFPFAVVRQLFERQVAGADEAERAALLGGPAGGVRPLLLAKLTAMSASDTSFSVCMGSTG